MKIETSEIDILSAEARLAATASTPAADAEAADAAAWAWVKAFVAADAAKLKAAANKA